MAATFETVIDAPIDEVFAWHARPGAFSRLTPPWLPLTLIREAESLRNGRAELRVLPGVNVVAQHVASGFHRPVQFEDRIVSFPVSTLLPWHHLHRFAEVGDGRTRVCDRVKTKAPAGALRSMFTYRHRQLADDLAAHKWAGEFQPAHMTIAVTGSSGMVGSALSAFLSTGGHKVIRLVRHRPRDSSQRLWNPDAPAANLLAGVDAVVHLAGAPIAGRFTQTHKRRVRDSRVGPTRRLAELAAESGVGVFVSASAIGFYGPDRGAETLTETSKAGDGFLADVVADWESAAETAAPQARVVQVRTGIVQSPQGGVLRLQRPLFSAGLGGKLGTGKQRQSWIGIDDLLEVYLRALVDDRLAGPVNAVAPNPVRNADYARVLATVLNRPAILPVPDFAPRLLLGEEGLNEFVLADQFVEPTRLRELGHRFRHENLEVALRHVLGKSLDT